MRINADSVSAVPSVGKDYCCAVTHSGVSVRGELGMDTRGRSVASARAPAGESWFAVDSKPERVKAKRLSEAAALCGPDAQLTTLVDSYWRYVPADEIADRGSADLLTAVESHRELARRRVPGELKLRISTPQRKGAGWCGGHTVIEVVTDDMPFLVDSVTAELTRHDIGVHLIVHPQVVVRREVLGELTEVPRDADPDAPGAEGEIVESWMHIEIDRQSDPDAVTRLQNDLQGVLTDVREAVEDWDRMRSKALALADELATADLPVPPKDVTNAGALLRWLAEDHFTFLGYREYRLAGDYLQAVMGSGLGILRSDQSHPRSLAQMIPEARAKAMEQRLLIITKANSRSTVHRPAFLDYIGFKVFDTAGNVVGEKRFLGLFSTSAYQESVRRLPVVSRKVDDVLERSGLSLRSHSGKDLLSILENYPRDELFQISTNELYDTAMGVLRLAGRRQLRLFLRRDAYGRFISCLVYLPRDRYTTQNRLAMEQILMEELHGIGVDYTTRVSEWVLARVKFIVRTDPTAPPGEIDVDALQTRLANVTRSWEDDFGAEIRREIGEDQAATLLRRYAGAFPEGYKAEHTAEQAVADLARIEMLDEPGELGMHLYRPAGGGLRFTVYRRGEAMSLSDVLPVLQSMGVRVADERPYLVDGTEAPQTWIYDFGLIAPDGMAGSDDGLARVHGAMENAFAACWRGECEVDGFNALVLSAGLTWDSVAVLRAYAKYLRQAGSHYSQSHMERVLVRHPRIARQLVELFAARFHPGFVSGPARQSRMDSLTQQIRAALDEVESLDEDRILRGYLTLVLATLRTNYFQRGEDGRHKPYLSLKINPQAVPDLPMPRPKFEIFVYSPRMEGVHLRFGSVARGGLRWSDRREDFRTEILGLVKAQMVKNTVIVPVGSKGGFVVKNPPRGRDREALQTEGVACYRMFISGLLDVTDNLVKGEVVPPPEVVRHDGDDPYLVVAADKGTATFSDIANEVAGEYGFWLGDAFASGGSVGYDHKGMGITARGAWESVKRHFRELGIDTQTQDFTVAGIGDMSGDVFGNGMLLSGHIRLVAAFDHRHVFIDPEPDAVTSFAERRRIFELPQSSWDSYDRSLISAGGGVWPRSAKSVPLSREMKRALGIPGEVDSLSPAELIRAILQAPVELLWNGGIGTYVKAAGETSSEVGDKSNDAVRVNGRDLRAKVVGEGGNLGLTQLGRIEYALRGGRINTDAIDNSAGVDTSDHEVNIKILLGQAVESGELPEDARNPLLAQMTDEVAELVLRDNYEQNLALGIARALATPLFSVHRRMMSEMEHAGQLHRALEFLPSEETCAEREAAGLGLTSPELSVLLAYVKIGLEEHLLSTSLPDEPWTGPWLTGYFPGPVREKFRAAMDEHPLRREIILTQAVNDMVNHGGVSFVYRAIEETGAHAADVLRAYQVITQVFGLREIWQATEAMDNQVDTDAQTAVFGEWRRVLDRGVRWLLQSRSGEIDVLAEIARLEPGISELLPQITRLFVGRESDSIGEHVAELAASGVPAELAQRSASALYGFGLLDVVELARRRDLDPATVADVYYAVSERFHMDDLLDRISALPRDDQWRALARMALRYDLYAALAGLTAEVLSSTDGDEPAAERVSAWANANSASITRAMTTLNMLPADGEADLATMSVVLRQVRTVVRASAGRT
jgi:glutamate dehydrogenase